MSRNILIIITAFILGIGAANVYGSVHGAFSTPSYSDGYELPSQVYSDLTGRAIERPSPSGHVDESRISVYWDRVVLDLDNVIFAKFTDTNSMDPVIDVGSHALEVVPESDAEVQEGDIIAYQNGCTGDGTIIHRVIKRGEDQLGSYWLAKGDNNPTADPCKVRFDEIKSVVVGIIY